MKLLVVNKFFYPKGGSEIYLREISNYQEAHGLEIIPFAMTHRDNWASEFKDFFVDEVDLDFQSRASLTTKMKITSRIFWSRQASQRLNALVLETKPDLAHIHMIAHQISPSILPVLRKHNVPVVMTSHEYKLICPNYLLRVNGENCSACNGNHFYRAVVKKCVKGSRVASLICAAEMYLHHTLMDVYRRNIEMFIAPSDFMRDKLIEFGFAPSVIKTIPNFVNVNRYNTHFNLGDYVLYFGRLSPEKGVLTLLKAAADIPEIKIIIAGTGPQRRELIEYVETHGLSNIEFTGFIQGEELRALVRKARFIAIPSECSENSPLSVLEAFAAGKPAVAANIGGLPELVLPGKTGLLFESGNAASLAAAVRELYYDDRLVLAMGKAARIRAEQDFSIELHYRRLMETYSSVLGQEAAQVARVEN